MSDHPDDDADRQILQFFAFKHLPSHLRETNMIFACLASKIYLRLPAGAEKTNALRKLLEAKDSGVRSLVAKAIITDAEIHGILAASLEL